MHINYHARLCSVLVAAVAGCLDGVHVRQHDTLYAALSRAESDHIRAAGLDDASLIVNGALDRTAVVAAVLARNPDLDVARATWRAAVAAYPSAIALDDPMARYALAPFSIGSGVPFGQQIEVSQKLPWPGKRQLRGDAAIADAQAMQADYESLRLELAEAAVQAFDDDYIAVRALEINQHHHELLQRIENSALAQYTTGHASQQDPLEARTRIIELERERLMLEKQRRVAVAMLNRLLRRQVDADLPPPPARLAVATSAATESHPAHPKQVAAAARVRARQADVDETSLTFYPDVEVMGSYDSMWDTWQHRWMIGIGIEIPLQRGKRDADRERARAEQAKATAELASVTTMLEEGRERARREVEDSTQALELYDKQLLPTARERVDAALAGFTAGQNPFSTVVMAEQELRDVELAIERTRADLDRQLATLARLQGRIPGGTP